MLQTQFPRPLGDVGNPQTFSFPVRPCVVQGATPQHVVRGQSRDLLQAFIEAGRALIEQGCSAISTSCGFLALWQRELQAALPVPVWTSSLLQLADFQDGRAGVITIEAASLTAEHLQAVGADPATPIEGITAGSPLHQTLLQDLAQLDPADAQAQVLAAATRLRQRCPQIDTLVLECTNLPPYAGALRAATGLRVLDITTLLNERMARQGVRTPSGQEC